MFSAGLCVIFNNMKERQTSISDIAHACGVSAMTVSRALRQRSNVHPETLAKILAKAEELGYFKSSRLGRPHRQSKDTPHRISLVLGGVGATVSIFHSRLVNTIQRTLIRHNCECVIYSNDGSYPGFLILLAALKRQKSDAVLIIGDFPESQLKTLLMNFPGAILLDNPGVDNFDATFSSFNFDNASGTEAMLKHLISRGRKRIVLLSGVKEHFFSRIMENSYRKVLSEAGINIDERMILHADFTSPGAAEVMTEFIRKDIAFDAVFSNDEMALGVYRVLQSNRITIGEDVAVAGCDDLPLGQMLYPALSTVSLDYGKLAGAAVEFILDQESFTPRRELIAPELIIRESTGK